MSKHITVIAKLTTDFKTYNGQMVSVKIDKQHDYLFSDQTLLYLRNDELYIIRSHEGLYVRRSINKRNPDPKNLGGIPLSSYLFGKVHMRRQLGHTLTDSKNVYLFTREEFRADLGHYSAYSFYQDLKDSNNKAVKTLFQHEMENDPKYIALPISTGRRTFSDIEYPDSRLMGANSKIVNITINVFYKPNNSRVKFTLSINQLFTTILQNDLCEYLIDPTICNEIMITKDHNGHTVRTVDKPGVMLSHYLFGMPLKRSERLNIKNTTQNYDYDSFIKPNPKTFSSKLTTFIILDQNDNQIGKQFYATTPVATVEVVPPTIPLNQPPVPFMKEIKAAVVDIKPASNSDIVTVQLPDTTVITGSVINVASLIKLLHP